MAEVDMGIGRTINVAIDNKTVVDKGTRLILKARESLSTDNKYACCWGRVNTLKLLAL